MKTKEEKQINVLNGSLNRLINNKSILLKHRYVEIMFIIFSS